MSGDRSKPRRPCRHVQRRHAPRHRRAARPQQGQAADRRRGRLRRYSPRPAAGPPGSSIRRPPAPRRRKAKASPPRRRREGKPPVFSTLENFTVNLAGDGEHFLQLGVVLQLKDEETADKVKAYLPQIRNKILLLLSAKTADELQTPKGKQALIDEILVATREPLHADGDNVQAVLLGGLLVQ